jgi:hypothetical protein
MRTHLKLKEVDDVLGGQKAWENVDKTTSKSSFGLARQTRFCEYEVLVQEADIVSHLWEMRPYSGVLSTTTDQICR